MTTEVNGVPVSRLDIPATGEWQLLEMKRVEAYILVHPGGRQAWFLKADLATASLRVPAFRYTNNPLADVGHLAKYGDLRPFHVDSDFDPTSLASIPTR